MCLQSRPNARMLRSTQFAIVRNFDIQAKTNLNRAKMVLILYSRVYSVSMAYLQGVNKSH